MKVYNRGVEINVASDKVALKINGLNVFGASNALYAGNSAKTAQNQIRGRLKLDVRPTGGTTEDYAFQIRSESAKTSGTHLGIDNETHLKATGAATIMSTRGVAVIDTGYTATGVSLIGVYGQARADGNLAGSGSMMAGIYGLIEASAAITASHVASAWLDSHQANTVTGEHELLYMTNNGAATMDQAIFLYPGNKITHLFTIDPTDDGLVDDATGETLTPVKKINVKIDGQTYVIHAGTSA
jgi:hypothetical protein